MRICFFIAVAGALVLGGCQSSGSSEPGFTKDDFKKTPPPPGWRGPGEPASGPAAGTKSAIPMGQPGGPGRGASGPPPGFK